MNRSMTMIWPNHTESLQEDNSILIETNEGNRENFFLDKRIKKYEKNGRKIHIKYLREKETKGERK